MSQLKFKSSAQLLLQAALMKSAPKAVQPQLIRLACAPMSLSNRRLMESSQRAHFGLIHSQARMFNLRQQSTNNKGDKDAQYEKSFENLFKDNSSQGAKNQQEKSMSLEEQMRLKELKMQEEQAKHEKDKAEYERKKQEDFEDMLSGKTKKRDEMNLQELFKDLYSQAKQVNTKEYINSAKSSVNSFSSLLERRRQKAADQKKDEATQKSEAVKEEKTAEEVKEEATQKTAGAAQQEQTTQEETKEQAHQKATEAEEPKEQKPSFKDKINEKTAAFSASYPRAASVFGYMKEVWQETFPNEQAQKLSKMEQRRQQAKLMKEYEENKEHIEALQEQIPDWKRGAVIVSDQQGEEEKPGLLKRVSGKVKSKISQTSAAKEFMESEQYKNLEKIRNEMKEFKSNLQEGIDNTQNPVVRQMRQATDLVFMESNVARAVKEMKKYDPEFDVLELQYEAEEVFKEFFCNFLAGNLEYLEKVSAMAGLAIVKGDIKRRETEGWRHKYSDILDCRNILFQGGQVPEKQPPQFSFTIEIQEINCKVSLKDENQITDGAEDSILQTTYRFVLSRRDEPDLALTGHYWEIVEFNKVGELAQIV